MATATQRIVPARLKPWAPRGDLSYDFGPDLVKGAYFRILCGNTFPSGQQCGHVLGDTGLVDPRNPASALAGGLTILNRENGGPAYLARAEDGGAALGLRVSRRLSRAEETQTGHDNDQDPVWVAFHPMRYRWVKEGEYFEILRRHKLGLTGQYTARRPLPESLAAQLEKEINQVPPDSAADGVTLSAERGVLGDTAILPARICCPRCSTPQRLILNEVRPPTPE
jgi:hypothetical protein